MVDLHNRNSLLYNTALVNAANRLCHALGRNDKRHADVALALRTEGAARNHDNAGLSISSMAKSTEDAKRSGIFAQTNMVPCASGTFQPIERRPPHSASRRAM